MKIKNILLKGHSIVTSEGLVSFDEEGVVEVSESLGESLASLPNFSKVEEVKIDFSKMKPEELIEYAQENNIDLGDAKLKKEILAILQA